MQGSVVVLVGFQQWVGGFQRHRRLEGFPSGIRRILIKNDQNFEIIVQSLPSLSIG